MSIKTRAMRLTGVLLASVLLSLSAGFAWTVADDYAAREVVPMGVTVAGHELGGLTRDQARQVIETNVAAPLFAPVTVTFEDRTFELDPEGRLSIDVDTMLEEAFDPKTGATVAERVYRRLADVSVPVDIAPKLSVDGGSLGVWLGDIATQVDTPSVDATFTITEDYEPVMRASATGYATNLAAAEELVSQALLGGVKTVELPVDIVEPAITEEDLGTTLLVKRGERRVYLYRGLTLEKSYGIAVGTGGYPTPRGDWEVTLKRYMPTWSNPGSAWAADMPATIPPGPSNPLGTRAINIDAPGIRFHGTTQNWSIGRAASHGCMRMHRWDIEDLYERVEVGDRVLICN